MSQLANLADDLAFVRQRVDRVNRSVFPSSILFLWAGIILAGSVLLDLAPTMGGAFWLVAGPVGGVLSAVLGWRWSVALGVENMGLARRQMLHWGGLVAALLVSQLLVMSGAMRGDAFGAQVMLIVSLSYFYAGIHMHKSLLWLSGIQAAAFLVAVLVPTLPQSISGIVMAAGFVWVGIAAHRHLGNGAPPPLRR